MIQDHNCLPYMDHLSRDCGTPETQLWADFRAICIFGIPEITGLGIWLMEVPSINTFLSLPPTLEESSTVVQLAPQQRSELELSKVLIGQVPQRTHYSANAP